MQWLLPHAIARQEQPLLALIPHREREHTVQMLDTIFAPHRVAHQQHFGVGDIGGKLLVISDRMQRLFISSNAQMPQPRLRQKF